MPKTMPSGSPLHILHILDHSLPLHSGYTFRSQSIFKEQAKRNWQVTVLTSPKHQESWKGKWESREVIGGFPYFRTPLSANPRMRGYYEIRLMSATNRRIREVASACRPSVIHAHSPVLNAIPARRAAKQLHIPFVYEIRAFWEDAAVDHGSYRENSWQYKLTRTLETWACKKADHVLVICDGLRQDLLKRGITQDKISIVPNGVEIEEFSECIPDEELAATWNLSGKQILGFLGSFYRYEGLDLAIDAFAALASKHKDLVLLLVGGGEMETSLKEKARSFGLTDRILFPGRLSHKRIPGIYQLADILVYPRYSMRLTDTVTPLKPLEAMAMGKAVIASDVGGHKELIIDGETGILFKAGNAAALSSAIDKLLTNGESRMAMAKRGLDWVRKQRCWDKNASVYENVYQKAIKKSF